jgi:hypothetical protein
VTGARFDRRGMRAPARRILDLADAGAAKVFSEDQRGRRGKPGHLIDSADDVDFLEIVAQDNLFMDKNLYARKIEIREQPQR